MASVVEENNSPKAWPWLGKLKRSLSYPDESDAASEMSEEDKEAVDRVMRWGTATEAERMRAILTELTEALEALKSNATSYQEEKKESDHERHTTKSNEDFMVQKLYDVKNIVEHVDFARAFVALNGLEFILGCVSDRDIVPRSVRSTCFSVLASLCENNPMVQYELLDHESARILATLYFSEFPDENAEVDESDGLLRGRIVQAMTSSVCGHAGAERLFCQNEQGRMVIESGLGLHAENETLPSPPAALRKRCLIFLRALCTSTTSTNERVEIFSPSIAYVSKTFLVPETEPDAEIRKMTLAFLVALLRRKKGAATVLAQKDAITSLGARRLWELCSLEDTRDFANSELELWKILASEVSKAS